MYLDKADADAAHSFESDCTIPRVTQNRWAPDQIDSSPFHNRHIIKAEYNLLAMSSS